jgi:hypothetical protein
MWLSGKGGQPSALTKPAFAPKNPRTLFFRNGRRELGRETAGCRSSRSDEPSEISARQ